MFAYVDPDPYSEYGYGSRKLLNTDPIRIRIHNTGRKVSDPEKCCGRHCQPGGCVVLHYSILVVGGPGQKQAECCLPCGRCENIQTIHPPLEQGPHRDPPRNIFIIHTFSTVPVRYRYIFLSLGQNSSLVQCCGQDCGSGFWFFWPYLDPTQQ